MLQPDVGSALSQKRTEKFQSHMGVDHTGDAPRILHARLDAANDLPQSLAEVGASVKAHSVGWGTVREADETLCLLHDRTFASHQEPCGLGRPMPSPGSPEPLPPQCPSGMATSRYDRCPRITRWMSFLICKGRSRPVSRAIGCAAAPRTRIHFRPSMSSNNATHWSPFLIPGVDKNDLDIQAKDNVIRISGRKEISYPEA